MNRSNSYLLTTFTILTAGSLWQLFDVFTLYLSYPTNVFIESRFQTDHVHIPAIQFCATIPTLTRNRTTPQIFKVIDPSKIIVSISAFINHDEEEDLKQYSLEQMSESLSLRYYCFSIVDFKGHKLSSEKYIRIKLNTINANGSWWMSYHEPWDIPSSYEWNQLELEQKHSIQVTHSTKSFYLLERPYPTNCANYLRDTEFMTQKDCIRRCRQQMMETKCGFLSHEVDVYKWEPTARFANTVEDENCGRYLNSRQICHKKCLKVDCVKHYHKPIKVTKRKHNKNYMELNVIVPSEPTTAYTHRPQIPNIQLFCLIASILGLWFGFSFLSIYYFLNSLLIKINSIASQRPRGDNRLSKLKPRLNLSIAWW